ncbi:PTS transporter subunit EIIB, partial [Cronobacter sakazakii]
MSKNYVALAGAVVEAIGGGGNVAAVTHCMTRLRFVLNDDSAVDAARLKAIPGVLGVVRNENQCQVIIGNTVSQAYAEVLKLLPEGARVERALPRNDKITLRRIGAGILDALIGTMSPLIPAIIGGSMVKLLAMVLEMSGVVEKGAPTLTLLNVIGDGAFFFLPIMVAASAAIKFKTNMSLAIAIAGVLVHPNFVDLMAKAAQGQPVDFIG